MPLHSGPINLATRKPPAHFSPVSATDEELSQAHYPPRPDPIKAPKKHAQWQQYAARNPEYVDSKLVEGEGGLIEARNWAGGVLYASPRAAQSDPTSPKDPFTGVQGSWVIPKSHPIKKEGKTQDGNYRLWTWIGIDGWTNKSSLKSGITSELKVQDGKVTEEKTNAAILFQSSDQPEKIRWAAFENFQVDPGDLVTSHVWYTTRDGKTTGYAWIYNQGRNQSSSVSIENVSLEGVTAQWIAAGKNPGDPQSYEFPNFGVTLFHDGLATHKSKQENSIDRAELIDAQDLGSYSTRAEDDILVFAKVIVKP